MKGSSRVTRAGLGLAVAILLLLALGVVGAGGSSPTPAAVDCNTIITSNIAQSTTWDLAGGPYCVRARVQVNAGVTLTIQPGVGVYFGANAALDVLGTLTAEGAAGQEILFSTESADPQPGRWGRLYVQSQGHASLAHCRIEYGGADGWAFRTDTSNAALSQCTIEHNAGDGIRIHGGSASPSVTGSAVRANTGAGVYIRGGFTGFQNQPVLHDLVLEENGGAALFLHSGEAGSYAAFPDLHNLALSGNGSDALNMLGGSLTFDLTLDGVAWLNGSPVLVTSGTLQPATGRTLTLAPGTALQFGSTAGTLVAAGGGTVVAEGSEALPVTIGPDPGRMQPGAWRGVKVWQDSHLRLAHCDIGYAGNDGTGLFIAANDVQVRHCRIHHSSGEGVRLWGSGGFTALIEDSLIDHNQGAAIYENPETQVRVPTYHNLTLEGNGSDALHLAGTNLAVDRTLDGPGSFNGNPVVLLTSLSTEGQATLTLTPGTTLKLGMAQSQIAARIVAVGTAAQPVVLTSNQGTPQPGDWARIVADSGSRFAFCEVGYGGGEYYPAALEVGALDVQVRNCRIHHSLTGGLAYTYYDWGLGPETARFENLALTDNGSAGLRVGWGAHAQVVHATLARNAGPGVWIDPNVTAAMTNTLVAGNLVGAYVEGELEMDRTLWDGNADDVEVAGDGSFAEAGRVEGAADLQADGYHLGCASAALQQGLALLADDIDGQPRPWPAGTPPDLGADESPCGQGGEAEAQKVALPPQWVVDSDTGGGRFRQEYLIGYRSSGAAAPLSVTDQLPSGLGLVAQDSYPAMSFQQQGQALAWQSAEPVAPGTLAVVHMDTRSSGLPPGTELTNVGTVDAGAAHFEIQADSTLPYVPPLLASAGDGETCRGRFPLSGSAQPGTTVRVYANYNLIGQVPTDASGEFSYTLNYPGTEDWSVTARACVGADCSADSNAVLLTPQLSFWCPRQTVWSSIFGARQFRDAYGHFTTDEPLFSLPWNAFQVSHELRLAIGTWPLGAEAAQTQVNPPTQIWVETPDGAHWTPDETLFPPNFDYIEYVFNIMVPQGRLTTLCFHVVYGTTEYVSCVTVYLVDPDGTVFDVTQGLDPEDPAATAVPGITVTCMISLPVWGGWVPWPAHLYNDQANPQVTGDDGYFAFFTPPGVYHLRVEGKPGYQDWRSPDITVISQVVHVNVPLTPWTAGRAAPVVVTPQGLSPATVSVAAGESVEWVSALEDLEELARYTRNPALRVLSQLDPLDSTLGWDAGMLAPGKVYRRQFTRPGTYLYTDGAGHTGSVVVLGRALLPVVRRGVR